LKTDKKNPAKQKKDYEKPALTTYGSIAQLTQTQAGECRDNENAFNNAQPAQGYTCS
jgi:hypothetical protein